MDTGIFAERMKQARDKKGMGLKELREAVGASQSAMSHYSTGKGLPSLDVAVKIADALGVSLDWLCGKDDRSKHTPKTLGDVVRMLFEIRKALGFQNTTIDAEAYERCEYGSSFNLVLTIIDCKELYNLYSREESIRTLASGNDLEVELYETWMNAQMAELDKHVIYDDNDLPF